MAKLIIRKTGVPENTLQITSPILSIGRTKDNALAIKGDRKVSRRHARIDFVDGHFFLTDLGSANGTFLNDRLIKLRTRLKDGDKIVIGDTSMVFFSEGGIVAGSFHEEKELQPYNPSTEPTVVDKTKVLPISNKETAKPEASKVVKPAASAESKPKEPVKRDKLVPPEGALTVNCPRCGTIIDTTNIPKGAKVGCARCKNIFTV